MKKFITIAAAGAFILSGMMTSANAQTTGDLQAQIDALLAQLAGMQTGTTTTVTGPAFVFSGTMRAGMSGPGVATLQGALNAVQNPDIVVDSKFGPATMAAVKQFQASQGLVADGIVGPQTGAALAAASTTVIVVPTGNLPEGCTSTSGYSSTTGKKCDEGTTPSGFPTTGGDEASLSKFSMDSEDDAEEGQMMHVATIEFDVEDGDAMVERLDLTFDNANVGVGADDEPWDVFETLTLMVDGDEIAEMDINDEDDWNEDNNPFVFRLTGLDYVVEEGETAEIEVYLTAEGNVDAPANADWIIYVDNEGVRTIDTAGITSYIGKTSDTVSFGVDEEGGDEDIQINSSNDDPNSSLLKVDENDDSDWYEVFVFELEAEENDIEVEDLVLEVLTTDGNYEDLVNDMKIEIDGEEFDDFEVAAGTEATTSADLTFDIDKDFTIDGDEEVMVSVWVEFKKADQDNDGIADGAYDDTGVEKIQVGVRSVTGEGVDDVSDTSTLNGQVHTLTLAGAEITNVNWVVTESQNTANGTIDFLFTVDNSDSDEDFDVVVGDIVDATEGLAFTDTTGTPETDDYGVLSRVSGDSVTPTGVVAADQQENDVTVTTVANTTVYSVTLNGTVFDITSDGDATATEIIAALATDINTDQGDNTGGSEPVTATANGTTLELVADVAGTGYTITVSANLDETETQANVEASTEGFTVGDGDVVNFRIRYVATGAGTYEVSVTEVAGVEIADDDELSPTMIL